MAQYRAIFQNAYFKGLATAAVVTMGLAAGQAQAADFASTPLADTNEVVWDSSNGESLSGSGEQQWNAPLNVKGQDSSSQNFKIAANGDNLTLSGTGSLTVDTKDAEKGISLEAATTGTLTVDISAINVKSGLLKVVSDSTKIATIKADTITLGQSVSEASLLSGEPTAVLDLGTKSVLGKVDPNGGSTINIFNGAALKIQNSGAEIADVAVNAKQLNISGGSILLGEGSQNAAAKIKISEGSMTAGNIVVATSGTATISAQKPTGSDAPVSFNVTGGNVEVSGTLKVGQDVAMSVTGDAKLYTKTTEAKAGIEIASGGVFKTSKEALLGLTTGKNSSGETYVTDAVDDKGAVNIANGGVLYITGENVSLKGLTLNSGAALTAKSITSTNNKGESTLKFDSLVIDEKVANSDKFNVDVVGTLTLGAGDYNGNTTGDKSFNKITAQNLAVGSTNPFNVGDTITLTSINEKSTETDKATAGTITGDFDLKADTGDLTVSGGNYNTSSNLTLTSGDLSVVNNGTNTSELTLTGNVVFNTKEATNGKLIASGTTAADVDRVVLDVSNATLSYNDNGSNAQGNAKINVDYATLKLNGDNLSELFERTTTSGAIATVNNGGKLVVTGDLELNADQIAATTITGKMSGINLTSGSLSVADTLIVNNVAETTGFSLGNNTADNAKVKANTLQTVMDTGAKDKVSALKSGTFIVTNGLVTDSTKGFELGEKATLQLGDFKKVSNTVSASETTNGTANYALTLNHADANLKVEAGYWTAKELTVTSGTLTVGNDGSKFDANGNALKSSLSVDKLVASDASKTVNVTKQGTLNTKEITVETGSITVNGNMSIDGKHTAAEGTNPEKFGISLKDDAITLNEGSTLTLGADANHALGLADATGVVSAVTLKGGFNASGSLVGENFSTVKLTLGKDVSFNADGLTSLKTALFGTSGTSGTISLGDAKIDLDYKGTADEPILEWNDVTADQKLVLPSFSDEKTKITTIKLTDTGPILGHFGSVQATGVASTQPIVVGNNGSLNSADVVSGSANKLFAYNEKGEVLGLSVSEKVNFALVNGGEAGKVTLGTDSSLLVDGGQANGKTVLAELTGKKSAKVTIAGDLDVKGKLDLNKVESKEGTTLNVAKDATLAGVSTLEGKTVVAGKLTAEQAFTSTGDLQVTDKTTFKGETKLSGQNKLADVDFNNTASITAGNTTVTGGLNVADTKALSVIGGAALDVKTLNAGGTGTKIFVGQSKDQPNGIDSTSGVLAANLFNLNGAYLVIDPEFGEAASFAGADIFGNDAQAEDAGIIDGNIYALQNAIASIGNKDEKAVKAKFAQFLDAKTGSLQQDGVGAIAYVAKNVEINKGSKIVVDPNATDKTYNANANNTEYSKGDLYLGNGAALAVDVSALADSSKAAITFDKNGTDATVYAKDSTKSAIYVTGSLADINKNAIKLFANKGGNQKVKLELGNTAVGETGKLTVQTINGLYAGSITEGDITNANVKLDFQTEKANQTFDVVSAPVKDTLLAAGAGFFDYDVAQSKEKVLGAVAEGITKDGNNFYYGKKEPNESNKLDSTKPADKAILDKLANGTVVDGVVYYAPENELIENILVNGSNPMDAETNTRLAVFGGAPQAAIEAGASTYEAISARMGVGVSGVSAAANGQGGAIWVTPVYKSADADGFNADNKSYGADVKLYGLALGADIEVAPNFKVGGMFNVGSGDADGQGLGSNVSNDFDYYGLGLYAGYSMDAFSLVADVTYTAVDNDIEGNTDLGKVNASIDSTNLSVGVTGQYKLSLAGMDVTPHAGLRYSMIDMDDYSTAYSQNDSDSINIFSLPVGVTIAKEYVTDTWTVKPSFDLTLTGNFGDDEVDATAKWNGYSNLSTTVKSEIMDNFTYGAAVGVSATSGNFGLGLGVNYTGSSNTDEFGVNANARYMF